MLVQRSENTGNDSRDPLNGDGPAESGLFLETLFDRFQSLFCLSFTPFEVGYDFFRFRGSWPEAFAIPIPVGWFEQVFFALCLFPMHPATVGPAGAESRHICLVDLCSIYEYSSLIIGPLLRGDHSVFLLFCDILEWRKIVGGDWFSFKSNKWI